MRFRILVVCAALAAAVVPVGAQGDIAGPITTRVAALLAPGGGTSGLYLKEVGGAALAGQNEDYVFEPASSIKVVIHLYAMRQVAMGNIALTDQVTKVDPPPANSSCPGAVNGTEQLQDALKKMMRYSDNAATKELMIQFGVDNLNDFAHNTLGLGNTTFHTSPDPPGFNAIGCQASGATNVDDNTTRLLDLDAIYEGVADGALLSGADRDTFYERMAGTEMFADEGYDFTGILPAIQSIAAAEAPASVNTPELTEWENQLQENAKGGSYTRCVNNACTDIREWLIMAGWAQLPTCNAGSFSHKNYVYGVFISDSEDTSYFTGKQTAAEKAFANDAEPLREQIHNALANWDGCFETDPPTITLSVHAGDNLDLSTGWYNQATSGIDGVRLDYHFADASGIKGFSCVSPTFFANLAGNPTSYDTSKTLTDGQYAASCGALDHWENSGAGPGSTTFPFNVNVDQTPPTVQCGSTPTLTLGGPAGSITATVTDTTSGPSAANVSAPAADTSSAGLKSAPIMGNDVAGNSTTVNCPYVVAYKFLGFFSPLPKAVVSGGSTVPVKFALADYNGARIPDAEAQAIAAACGAQLHFTLGDPAPNCFAYSAKDKQFQFDLKTPKATGPATITATVAVGGTTVNSASTDLTLK